MSLYSYPISLSQWSNSSHSMTNLYLGKYRSILYFPVPNYWIISSPLKSFVTWLKLVCSLPNHLLLWSTIPRHLVRFIKWGVGFLQLLITYKRSHFDKKKSPFYFADFWAQANLLDTGMLGSILLCYAFHIYLKHSMTPDFKFSNMCPFKPRISVNINNRFNFIWQVIHQLPRHLYFAVLFG